MLLDDRVVVEGKITAEQLETAVGKGSDHALRQQMLLLIIAGVR